jgi:hypothetical protein
MYEAKSSHSAHVHSTTVRVEQGALVEVMSSEPPAPDAASS